MKTVLSLCCFLIIITSCKKKDFPVIPDARMYADKTIINKGDTVTFTNSSDADYAAIFISRAEELHQGSQNGYSFTINQTNIYKHVFNDTGNFVAELHVNNTNSSIHRLDIPITVNP
jgi:hypothetical protein